MRFAYADPPYPGTARRRYGQVEVDLGELRHRLAEFDGWALHTNPQGLLALLPLFPSSRIMAWCKADGLPVTKRGLVYSWEPILLKALRPAEIWVRDSLWVDSKASMPVAGATPGDKGRGWKAPGVIQWVFKAAGLQATDDLEDLFPGSGAVQREWDKFRAAPELLLAM